MKSFNIKRKKGPDENWVVNHCSTSNWIKTWEGTWSSCKARRGLNRLDNLRCETSSGRTPFDRQVKRLKDPRSTKDIEKSISNVEQFEQSNSFEISPVFILIAIELTFETQEMVLRDSSINMWHSKRDTPMSRDVTVWRKQCRVLF